MTDRSRLFDICVLLVLGMLIYLGSLTVPFVYDDIPGIVDNQSITSFATSFAQLFSTRGLSNLTLAINYQLSGLTLWPFHLVNIAIHLSCGVLVYLLLHRFYANNYWLPLFGAAVFLVHPIQTQAVTYIVQRMASLGALLVLLSVYCFIRAREVLVAERFGAARHLAWYAGCLAAACLAVLAKENTIIIPALLLLVAWVRDPEQFKIKYALLYIAPLAISALMVALYLILSGCLVSESLRVLELFVSADSGQTVVANAIPYVRLKYFITQLVVIWHYVRLLVFPWGQVLDYSYPLIQDFFDWRVMLAVFGWGGLVWGMTKSRNHYLLFSLLWFLLSLVVESSFLPLEPIFEHRLYLPMFGVVVGLCEVWRYYLFKPRWRILAVGVVVIFSVLTVMRNQVWRDPVALWTDNLVRVPYSYRVKLLLAETLLKKGREAEWIQLVKEVMEREPSQSMIANVTYSDNLVELGKAYIRFDRADQAVKIFQKAIRYYPKSAMAYLYLGSAYGEWGDQASAYRYIATAYNLDPNNEMIRKEYEKRSR